MALGNQDDRLDESPGQRDKNVTMAFEAHFLSKMEDVQQTLQENPPAGIPDGCPLSSQAKGSEQTRRQPQQKDHKSYRPDDGKERFEKEAISVRFVLSQVEVS
jgi:hypothetical protein